MEAPGHPQSPQKIQTLFQNRFAKYKAYEKPLGFARNACICGWVGPQPTWPYEQHRTALLVF
jgi:hypothetical protein